MGEDCLPDTDDDTDDNEPFVCPEDYVWDSNICSCVTRENPNCEPGVDDNYLCIWDTVSLTRPGCECITQEAYIELKEDNDLGEDCLPGTDDDTPDEDPRCEGYPAGWYYDEELCQCVSSGAECEVTCEGDLHLDPVSKCTCLTTFELGPLYSNACDP